LLSLGEAPRADDRPLDRLVLCHVAVEMREDLRVADRLARGRCGAQARGAEPDHLVDPPRLPHAVDSGLDPPAHDRTLEQEADLPRQAYECVARYYCCEGLIWDLA